MSTPESAPSRAAPGRRTIESEQHTLSWGPAAPIPIESPAERRRRRKRQIGIPALALALVVLTYLGAVQVSQILLQPRQAPLAGQAPSAACLARADAQPGHVNGSASSGGLTREQQLKVMDSLVGSLGSTFVWPACVDSLAARLRQQVDSGAYDGLDAPGFALAVTHHLQDLTADQHLALVYSQDGTFRQWDLDDAGNAGLYGGMRDARIIRGNIGYLRSQAFFSRRRTELTIDLLMDELSTTDALILDLRQNSGGDVSTAMLLASYLLDRPGIPLLDIHTRDGQLKERLLSGEVHYPRFGATKPVFVLISHETASAGEALAFVLSRQRHALLVGQPTAGASHASQLQVLDGHFGLFSPCCLVVDPTTGEDWEGSGLAADVADSSPIGNIEFAYKLALERTPISINPIEQLGRMAAGPTNDRDYFQDLLGGDPRAPSQPGRIAPVPVGPYGLN